MIFQVSMAKRSDLFDVIHSLTKSEKRYFKLYTSLHTKGKINHYVQLFDMIDRQEVYGEEALRKEFEDRTSTLHFAEAKHYLYQTILKALHLFHLEDSPDNRIQMLIHEAEILYKKKLYRQFNKILAKAKDIAIAYEKPLYLIDILSLQYRSLILEQSDTDVCQNVEYLFTEMLHYNAHQRNNLEYWRIHARIFLLIKSKGAPRNEQEFAEYKRIMEDDLMQEEAHCLSPTARIYYDISHALYQEVIQNYEGSTAYHERILEGIQASRTWKEPDWKAQIPSLYNVCLMSIKAYREDIFFRYYPRLLECTEKQPDSEIYRTYIQTLTLMPHWYIKTGNFEQALEGMNVVEDAIRQFKGKLRLGMESYIDALGFNAAFGMQKYARSLDYLNRILDRRNTDISDDAQYNARLAFLIVQFELQNYDLLEYLLKSTYRYLLSRKCMYMFETVILNFIRAVLRNGGRDMMQSHFQNLYDELVPLQHNLFENPPFSYFDYLAWVKSKLSDRSFAEVVREQYAEHVQPGA